MELACDMEPGAIRAKFGQDYIATERTFVMGIDLRFTARIAARFRNRCVLETCTGGGFTTVALARAAAHVITVEIDPVHQTQARQNLAIAGLQDRVTFVLADIMNERTWEGFPRVEAALLDPDWAVTGPDHVHRFIRSTTRPPADALLERTFRATPNVALILPPLLDIHELNELPDHERQRLYLDQSHELYCLYFGDLAVSSGETELHV
jgi:SAM-dependent methyltransferase